MGLLDRLKKAFTAEPPLTLDDEQFGRIVFVASESWQGAPGYEEDVTFAPTQEKIGITISGDENGPSSIARDLFRELERRYSDLILSIAPLLRDDSSSAMLSDSPVSDQDVLDSFKLCSVFIVLAPQKTKPQIILTYSPDWRPELLIDVTVRNWETVDAEGYD